MLVPVPQYTISVNQRRFGGVDSGYSVYCRYTVVYEPFFNNLADPPGTGHCHASLIFLMTSGSVQTPWVGPG